MIKINFDGIKQKLKKQTNKIPRISGNNVKRRTSKFISNLKASPRRFRVFSKRVKGRIDSQIERLKKAQVRIPPTNIANTNKSNKKPRNNKPANGNRVNGNPTNKKPGNNKSSS